jgi:hypothetical protein
VTAHYTAQDSMLVDTPPHIQCNFTFQPGYALYTVCIYSVPALNASAGLFLKNVCDCTLCRHIRYKRPYLVGLPAFIQGEV